MRFVYEQRNVHEKNGLCRRRGGFVAGRMAVSRVSFGACTPRICCALYKYAARLARIFGLLFCMDNMPRRRHSGCVTHYELFVL